MRHNVLVSLNSNYLQSKLCTLGFNNIVVNVLIIILSICARWKGECMYGMYYNIYLFLILGISQTSMNVKVLQICVINYVLTPLVASNACVSMDIDWELITSLAKVMSALNVVSHMYIAMIDFFISPFLLLYTFQILTSATRLKWSLVTQAILGKCVSIYPEHSSVNVTTT
jgi:hypothetical protein